jgi:hypothetical protein
MLRQSIAPLHNDVVEQPVHGGQVATIAGGANVWVEEATDDFVVRRMAASCAHNLHAQMMEAKLVADGVDRAL